METCFKNPFIFLKLSVGIKTVHIIRAQCAQLFFDILSLTSYQSQEHNITQFIFKSNFSVRLKQKHAIKQHRNHGKEIQTKYINDIRRPETIILNCIKQIIARSAIRSGTI